MALAAVVAACGLTEASPPAAPTREAPAAWREHKIATSRVALSLPPDWLAFGEEELTDADVRADLEAGFAGARGLFGAVDAQGSRVRLVLVGVDPAARGRPQLAPAIALIAVEPRIPALGLGFGADFVLDALDSALVIETEIERDPQDLPVGDAVRFGFDHRVVDAAGGPGILATLEGALVTTDESTFLVLHNVDAETPPAGVPSIDEVLAALRVLP